MIFLKESLTHRDLHHFNISPGPFSDRSINPEGTHYLFGKGIRIELENGTHFFSEQYAALSLVTPYRILEAKSGMQISFPSHEGLNQWCEFKSEQAGRLSYIDGCSNTNLIAPLRNGDPCVNHLYIPAGTEQSAHVHPSARIGIISGGHGVALVWDQGKKVELELREGMKFLLPRMLKHCFHTFTNSHLSVLVFHPDSEGGPRDQMNPMFTRTFLSLKPR